MKDLYKYIIESTEDGQGGSWQDFVDEETGEITQMWVPDIDPEEEKRKVELAKIESENFKRARTQEKEIRKQLEPLEDELYGYQQELKDINREYRDLQIDHEEEVGALYIQGKEAKAEALAQKYGVKFNKLEKRQQVLKNKIKKLEPKVHKLQWKCWKLWDF